MKRYCEDDYITAIYYDEKGRRQKIYYGNGTHTSYTYDPLSYQLTRLKTQKNTDIFQDLNYWYDPVGNITTVKDDAQRALYFNNAITLPKMGYTYDALYRLIRATGREQIGTASFGSGDNYNDSAWMGITHKGDDNNTQNYIQKYTYDEVGNILSLQHIADTASYIRNYTYDTTNNRLLSTAVGANTYSYSYDNRGNMVSMPHLSAMQYNSQNQLSTVDLGGGGDAYYQYSGGERSRKVIVNGAIVEERIYLGSYEIYRKFVSSSLTLERTTVHVADDTGRLAMLEVRTVGTDPSPATLTRYIYSNHLGTASLELDDTAAIISYEEYHPYGTTSYQAKNASINATAKRYRYTGKERDEESGLYYHGARYYMPWLCRWCAVDPLEGEFCPASPYSYCNNNPVKLNDPTGNAPIDNKKGQEAGNIFDNNSEKPKDDSSENKKPEKDPKPKKDPNGPADGSDVDLPRNKKPQRVFSLHDLPEGGPSSLDSLNSTINGGAVKSDGGDVAYEVTMAEVVITAQRNDSGYNSSSWSSEMSGDLESTIFFLQGEGSKILKKLNKWWNESEVYTGVGIEISFGAQIGYGVDYMNIKNAFELNPLSVKLFEAKYDERYNGGGSPLVNTNVYIYNSDSAKTISQAASFGPLGVEHSFQTHGYGYINGTEKTEYNIKQIYSDTDGTAKYQGSVFGSLLLKIKIFFEFGFRNKKNRN